MKTISYIFLLVLLVVQSCKKENEAIPSTGTVTIDNTTFLSSTYYIFGYNFSLAKKIPNIDEPRPDVSVDVKDTNVLFLQADNLKPSFIRIGEYVSESDATNDFNNLKQLPSNAVWVDLAEPLMPNQIWVYRSGGNEKYTKVRIISIFTEQRLNTTLNRYFNYGECTFEYVYQPNGSPRFP